MKPSVVLNLSIVAGDTHRRQKKIMNPCFGPAQMRDLMPVFYDKAAQVCLQLPDMAVISHVTHSLRHAAPGHLAETGGRPPEWSDRRRSTLANESSP